MGLLAKAPITPGTSFPLDSLARFNLIYSPTVQDLHTVNRLLESCAKAQELYPTGSSTLATSSGTIYAHVYT